MRSGRGIGFAGTMILGASLLVTGGCGYKNLPVPPETVVPKAIEDLRYTRDNDAVDLSWTYPVETINGNDILAVPTFDLYRAEIALDDYCPTCPIPFGEPIEVPGGVTQEEGQVRTATYRSGLLRPGHKYFFKVQARTNWWAASDDSNIITFVWQKTLSAPAGVKALAVEGGVVVNWQPITSFKDGSELAGDVVYQVYKSSGKDEFQPLGKPTSSTSVVDNEVDQGVSYQYRVQSQLDIGKENVAGEMSPVVVATALDTTPPSVPTAVKAIGTAKGVKVIWTGAREDDLAGYKVYRKGGGQGYELIGTVKAPHTIFEDTTAGQGASYSYAVTSYDTANPANESKKSKEASIRP